jgi:hypothetical protein
LRPGATAESDTLLLDLLRRWGDAEQQLGLEIDARVIAYVASADPAIDDALEIHPVGSEADQRRWRFNLLTGLLWPRGGDVRAAALGSFNPFAELPSTDRSWVLTSLADEDVRVDLAAPDWEERVRSALARDGRAVLWTGRSRRHDLAAAVARLIGEPVEVRHLHVYPRIVGLTRSRGIYEMLVELREAVV